MLRSHRGDDAMPGMDDVAEFLDISHMPGSHLADKDLMGGL